MRIGDRVKLRNIPENNRTWLKSYMNMVGIVVDYQARSDRRPPKHVRVSFIKGNPYEDLATWRVKQI